MSGRTKYLELLQSGVGAAVAKLIGEDMRGAGLAPLEVKQEAQAAEMTQTLSLPLSFGEPAALPRAVPFRAPFSAMVPEIMRVTHGWAAQVCWGAGPDWQSI
jgi:exocyst complex component 6